MTPPRIILVFLILAIVSSPINGLNPRKLDDSTLPGPDGENKCGGCVKSPPPPSSCPPPPSLPPPPPPPPPAPKKPPTPSNYCPPPPPSYIYINGPPGNLYPVDQYFSGSRRSFGVGRALLVGSGLVGLLVFW
ncbi:hypothetical protein LguiA_031579 [Lonicera macranthoides]